MKKMIVVILISGLLAYAGTKLLAVETASGLTSQVEYQSNQADSVLENSVEQIAAAQDNSCANPVPEMAANCREMEQQILNSSVRIFIYTSLIEVNGSCCQTLKANGYATIKEGRYLITHNHYHEEVMSLLQQGDPQGLVYINVIKSSGEVLLTVVAKDITVNIVDRETMIMDFGLQNGIGTLEAIGLSSAQFADPSRINLQPGMEVAQINWDGATSFVQWTTIETVESRSDTPVARLTSCILKGASGGGLFWQGVHIGNNWSTSPDCGGGMDYSFVALNSQAVIGF